MYHVDHVDIPEKTDMLMLSEPEPEESYNYVGANVEMTPLNISETDCANAQVVTKETGEELELRSPVSVEAVNRDLSTPAQETSVLHKQTLVLPSSKEKSHTVIVLRQNQYFNVIHLTTLDHPYAHSLAMDLALVLLQAKVVYPVQLHEPIGWPFF